MRRIEHFNGVLSQQGADLDPSCDDEADAIRKVVQASRLGTFDIVDAVTRPGGGSRVQWQAKIPSGTAYPVSLEFGARNLGGPSVLELEIAGPTANP